MKKKRSNGRNWKDQLYWLCRLTLPKNARGIGRVVATVLYVVVFVVSLAMYEEYPSSLAVLGFATIAVVGSYALLAEIRVSLMITWIIAMTLAEAILITLMRWSFGKGGVYITVVILAGVVPVLTAIVMPKKKV